MISRPLGSTGISVSVLGLGTVKFGRNRGVRYPGGEGFPLPTDSELEALLDLALSLGITLLDTAPAYGTSEERLGKLLGARRERFAIVTKVGEEFEDGVSRWDYSTKHVEESVTRSLRRLRTDRLEGVLVHCDRNDVEALSKTPVLETLEALKHRGLIRSFGASTYTPEAGLLAAGRGDVVMVEHEQLSVIEQARSLGKGVLVKKGLQSGHLAEADRASTFRAILGTPGVTSLVVGTTAPGHLRENARLAGFLV